MSVMEVSHRGTDFIEFAAQSETNLRELLERPGRLPRAVPARRRDAAVRGRAAEPRAAGRRSSTTSSPATGARRPSARPSAMHAVNDRRRQLGRRTTRPSPRLEHVAGHRRTPRMCTTRRTRPSTAWSSTTIPRSIGRAARRRHVLDHPVAADRREPLRRDLRGRAEEHRARRARDRDRARRPARHARARDAGRHRLQDHGRRAIRCGTRRRRCRGTSRVSCSSGSRSRAGSPRCGASTERKAQKLYAAIDALGLLHESRRSAGRSWMNVPFTLADPDARQDVPQRVEGRGPHEPQGPPLGRRHAREHLQRDARGGRRRADRVHGRLREAPRLRRAP